jgi:hypothetical protein
MFTKLLGHVFHHNISVDMVWLLNNEKQTSETLFIHTIKEGECVCMCVLYRLCLVNPKKELLALSF